jgi:hypothetical protein
LIVESIHEKEWQGQISRADYNLLYISSSWRQPSWLCIEDIGNEAVSASPSFQSKSGMRLREALFICSHSESGCHDDQMTGERPRPEWSEGSHGRGIYREPPDVEIRTVESELHGAWKRKKAKLPMRITDVYLAKPVYFKSQR